ncbi:MULTISPECIES: DUF6344 domain-containing protein [Streptomyces]|uniref:DUF6344 domain-containing protein n=1 Tax=Streptomyces TaxID=1883 RepID=UPI0013DD0DF9|nr:DUF6344 domain-containing protein [Streptomyces aureoverticillatus]QIB44729.1 hypothetical protein G3H79_18230 [Streptomyces aureoverticillatus]
MTATKAMKLWTTIVTAVLALFATLGLTSTATAAAPAQQATSASAPCTSAPSLTAPMAALWAAAYERSLPPTMKQRIRAEAHGATPSCRHLPTTETEAQDDDQEPTAGNLAAEP